MYEYTSKSDKKREKLIVLGLLILGFLFYGGSMLPQMPFPAIFQCCSFAAFLPMIVITVRCLLTSYTYRVEIREESDVLAAGRDLVILEKRGKRVRTVCRVGVETIRSMTPVTRENKQLLAEISHSKTVYAYVAELFAPNRYLLEIVDENQSYCLRILSDEDLKKLVFNH